MPDGESRGRSSFFPNTTPARCADILVSGTSRRQVTLQEYLCINEYLFNKRLKRRRRRRMSCDSIEVLVIVVYLVVLVVTVDVVVVLLLDRTCFVFLLGILYAWKMQYNKKGLYNGWIMIVNNLHWSLVFINFHKESTLTLRRCLKLFNIFPQNQFVVFDVRCMKFSNNWKLMYSNGSYWTCNNLWFGKILNNFKRRLLVKVLLTEINKHQRSKERRHSHDTSVTLCMVLPSVREDNPRVSASGLSPVQTQEPYTK